MTTTPTRAVIYARISQDRTGAGLGIDRQEAECRDLAGRLPGVTVTEVYSDDDISAYKRRRRPGYEAMLAAIEAGEVDMVIVWHNDRLHRNMAELERYIDAANTIPTQTVKAGAYDLSTPSGRMTARILGAVAVQESEHKAERISAAREQGARLGTYRGGTRPYGYDTHGTTLVLEEAEVIKSLAGAVVAGRSLRSLAKDLNERGVPTAKGGTWVPTQIKDMLIAPRIAGLSVYNGEVVGRAQWPAIITEDTWRAAVSILTNPARRTNGHAGAGVQYLGSGLYRCGACGAPMMVASSPTKARTYRCSAHGTPVEGGGHVSRGVALLDLYVEAALVARLQMPGWVLSSIETDDPELAATLTAELDLLRSRKDDLVSLMMAGDIDRSQLATGTAEFNVRAEEITKTLARLGKRSPLSTFKDAEPADIPAIWAGLDLDQRRAVLSFSAVVTVNRMRRGARFDPAAVDIDWKF